MNLPPECLRIQEVLSRVPVRLDGAKGNVFKRRTLLTNISVSSVNPFARNFIVIGGMSGDLTLCVYLRKPAAENCFLILSDDLGKLNSHSFDELAVFLHCSVEEFLESFRERDFCSFFSHSMQQRKRAPSALDLQQSTGSGDVPLELSADTRDPNVSPLTEPERNSVCIEGETEQERLTREVLSSIPEALKSLDGIAFERYTVDESILQANVLLPAGNVIPIGVIQNGSGVYLDLDRESGRNCCLLALEVLYLHSRYPFAKLSVCLECSAEQFFEAFPKHVCPASPVDYDEYNDEMSGQLIEWLRGERLAMMAKGVLRRDRDGSVPPSYVAILTGRRRRGPLNAS